MYYSILSSELLSNGYFLFFTNAFIGEDVMIYKHLLFSIFYFKKKTNLSVILLSIGEHADGENCKL